jgi:phage terminase small subunit
VAAKKLTAKQQRFVEEYLVDLNATQAAIRAGYSKNNADKIGSQQLGKTRVRESIDKALNARSKRTEITADMVIAELARVGFSNMSNYARWNEYGVLLTDSDKLTDDAARCVSEVSQTVTAEGGTVKFKLHDKVAALEKLGRHLGIFTDKVEVTGKDGAALAAPIIYLPANGRDSESN